MAVDVGEQQQGPPEIMDVLDRDSIEEKMEVEEDEEETTSSSSSSSEDDDEGDIEQEKGRSDNNGNDVPFLDTFYGLSSVNPRERARAAQDMIRHCLASPDTSNIKDASYAFRRLLSGLCSGRAAARQGNASALASFVKLAAQQGKLKDIQLEYSARERGGGRNGGDEEAGGVVSDLRFVRRSLIAATEPTSGSGTSDGGGRRKGSEERDYKFGRLFGILAVVRSDTLLPKSDNADDADADEIVEVTTEYLKDLGNLYGFKKWMREPAAHALGCLLSSFYSACSEESPNTANKIVHHLVTDIIVPVFLAEGDNNAKKENGQQPLFATYSSEQIALALTIQSNASFHSSKGLPSPIDRPVLCKETLPIVAPALSETSSVTQPRTHLVWDALVCYVSHSEESSSSGKTVVDVRRMMRSCPLGSENVHDLIDALIRSVVMDHLLGLDEDGADNGHGSGKSTHERSALALCLIRNLSGVEFVSSITGRTRLIVDSEMLERLILRPGIVKLLFLKTMATGTGGHKKHAHLLRPLAFQVLESVVATVKSGPSSPDQFSRRLAFAESLLRCDPRFDSKTKSDIVAQLVGIEGDDDVDLSTLWIRYVDFLERQIINVVEESSDADIVDTVTPYQAQGYLDLLFRMAKTLTRKGVARGGDNESSRISRRIVGFLMSIAFFDCHSVTSSAAKRKKSKNALNPSVNESAELIRNHRPPGAPGRVPYPVRSVASARFYSLTAESIAFIYSSFSGNDKDWEVLNYLSFLINAWGKLEEAGARSLADPDDNQDEPENETPENPKAIVIELQRLAELAKRKISNEEEASQARFKCNVGFAVLASTLFIHLLSCGRSEEIDDDDLDADDESDADYIRELLSDLKEVSTLYSEPGGGVDDPLSALTEICVNILSSPLASGNQSRGASPKLIREAVKCAWVGGLTLSAAADGGGEANTAFVDILLGSIGAEEDDGEGKAVSDSDGEIESGSEDESESEEVNRSQSAFPVGSKDVIGNGDVDMKEDNETANNNEADDVELDPNQLQSFLEEESDADVSENELEHHAGADKALAKLIQIKQEARKAGQMARERAEITQQLRCMMLLEVLVVGRTDGWGALLSNTPSVLKMFLPILHYRREVEKSISNATERGSDAASIGEKRALLDRLTSLLKTKVLKMKYNDRRWNESADIVEVCSGLASNILDDAKGRVTKEHRSCCSAALVALIRAIPASEMKVQVAEEVYGGAILEWVRKRTTRLEASLFDELINQSPLVAQASLTKPLAQAATEARSAFLKCESLRLLSMLHNSKLNTKTSELEKLAFDRMLDAADPVLDAFLVSLNDDDMRKTKRAREVLKAMERVFAFLASDPKGRVKLRDRMDLVKLLSEVKSSTESHNVASSCDKLLLTLKSDQTQAATKDAPPDLDSDDGEETEDKQGGSSQKKKRKKKKSKKRKR